jgi:uncharacterized delta-60 repeat protein
MRSRYLLGLGAAALLTVGMAAVGVGSAGAASGGLDPSFGGDGTVDAARATADKDQTMVATQPDGKILVVSPGLPYGTDVARFNADGSPDGSFGSGGLTTLPMEVIALELLVTSDGGIVVIGTAGGESLEPGLVVKLTSAGQPDTGFGVNGNVVLDAGEPHALINLTAAYEQNGGLVVVGDKWTLTDQGSLDFAVNGGVYAARLTLASGELDASFGTGGESFSDDLFPSGVCSFKVVGAVPQPSGNTAVSHLTACGSGAFLAAYQLTSSGTLALLNDEVASMTGGTVAGTVAVPGGGVLVAAHAVQAPIGSSNIFFTVNEAGQVTSTYTEDSTLAVNGLAALPDGRIATSAFDFNDAPAGGVQVRSIAGQLDPSFADDGTADTGRPVWGVAAAPDAKLVSVGEGPNNVTAYTSTFNIPELARYLLQGGGVLPVEPKLTPLTPARILDTRSGNGYSGPKPGADTTITLQVAGRGGVPATGAAAVVLNVTATEADGPGFVTVWPSDQPRPLASNLNLSSAGQTIPNLVTVPVGADGAVKLYTLSGAHLIADVAAWYPPGAGFVPLTPNRILDTRNGNGYSGPKPTSGATVDLVVAGRGGVPATGATAVVLNVTATEADGPGFVTAWPSGLPRPLASNLNLTQAGQTIPNQVYVPLGANGSVSLFTYAGAHLIADVAGYFTPGGGFTPLTPDRILDTRSPGTGYNGAKPGPGATVAIQVAGAGGVPATGATAVVLNVTATEADGPGFVTAWPSGSVQPLASNLNLTQAGQTIANLVVVPIGPDGKVLLYTLQGTHLVADVAGYIS